MFLRLSIFILLALILSYCVIFGESKKKSKLVINYKSGVTVCDDESKDFMDPSRLKATQYNETTAVLNGTFQLKTKVNGKIKMTVVVEKIIHSGAKELITSYENQDFCEEVKNREMNTLVGQYIKVIDFPPECPIPAGTYTMNNMVATTEYLPLNPMLVGPYTLTMTYYSYEVTGSGFLAQTSKIDKLGCVYFDISVDQAV